MDWTERIPDVGVRRAVYGMQICGSTDREIDVLEVTAHSNGAGRVTRETTEVLRRVDSDLESIDACGKRITTSAFGINSRDEGDEGALGTDGYVADEKALRRASPGCTDEGASKEKGRVGFTSIFGGRDLKISAMEMWHDELWVQVMWVVGQGICEGEVDCDVFRRGFCLHIVACM